MPTWPGGTACRRSTEPSLRFSRLRTSPKDCDAQECHRWLLMKHVRPLCSALVPSHGRGDGGRLMSREQLRADMRKVLNKGEFTIGHTFGRGKALPPVALPARR